MQSSPTALFTPLQWGLNVVFTPYTVQTFILVCVMAHTLHVQQKTDYMLVHFYINAYVNNLYDHSKVM